METKYEVPAPWWLWNFFFILEFLGSENVFGAVAAVLFLWYGYSRRRPIDGR